MFGWNIPKQQMHPVFVQISFFRQHLSCICTVYIPVAFLGLTPGLIRVLHKQLGGKERVSEDAFLLSLLFFLLLLFIFSLNSPSLLLSSFSPSLLHISSFLLLHFSSSSPSTLLLYSFLPPPLFLIFFSILRICSSSFSFHPLFPHLSF
jgi:hypothetical protein